MEISPFAQRLEQLMSEKGIDRMGLSRATGIPYHRITPWFRRSTSTPKGTDLLLIANFFQVSEAFLLNGGERGAAPKSSLLEKLSSLDPASRDIVEAYVDGLLSARRKQE
ncbi:helix-turn-helix transcriptional regulator [Cereibacter sp. SYSU M97828]|nr:helix-turn-helix transcriptional regulator [Cereibacter flavus]